jgi:uncharacterized membrane protein
MMGLIRLIILFLVLYFIFRLIRRLIQPEKRDHVRGNPPPKNQKNLGDIEDAEYEDLE